jgi:hypothetical protein
MFFRPNASNSNENVFAPEKETLQSFMDTNAFFHRERSKRVADEFVLATL